jgi:putative endonuclease
MRSRKVPAKPIYLAEQNKTITYVYLLISEKDPMKIYIGRTSNLEKRLAEHNRGESAYTKAFAPWKIETYIAFSNAKLADTFEKYLKVGSGFAFMKKRLLPEI